MTGQERRGFQQQQLAQESQLTLLYGEGNAVSRRGSVIFSPVVPRGTSTGQRCTGILELPLSSGCASFTAGIFSLPGVLF